MDKSGTFYLPSCIIFTLTCSIFWPAYANPVYLKTDLTDNEYITNSSIPLDCNPLKYSGEDVLFFENNDLFLKFEKLVIHSENYRKEGNNVLVCPRFVDVGIENLTLHCIHKFVYSKHEYDILENGSATVQGYIIPREEYMLKGEVLQTCADEDDDPNDASSSGWTLTDVTIVIGKTGSIISIIALIMHVATFCFLPTLRNLPGYNLASLSIAFLLAYLFVLIGQIPEVLGLSCYISAVLQQYFFLAAFFCMNVLAFDVWRTLKLATEKLAVGSQRTRKRQYLWYSLYAWGCPLFITAMSIIADNVDGVPDEIKPYYGHFETCWLNNSKAKILFFAAPAFTLFIINGIFFLRSFFMIYSNTMKLVPADRNKQAVKLNFVLYIRLAMMMGLTWLIGVIALVSKVPAIWVIFDVLNSLQGLFLFLLFTCTKKVMKHLIERTTSKTLSAKRSTISISTSNINSKN